MVREATARQALDKTVRSLRTIRKTTGVEPRALRNDHGRGTPAHGRGEGGSIWVEHTADYGDGNVHGSVELAREPALRERAERRARRPWHGTRPASCSAYHSRRA